MHLPSIFADHMVLQRDARVPVWGWGEPREEIAVFLGARQALARADDEGHWGVELEPMPAGGPLQMTVAGAGGSVVFSNVMVGDVWVCSGQSNMAMMLKEVMDGKQETSSADHPDIRLLTVARVVADEPAKDIGGSWAPCNPHFAGDFSAVAFFFGRMLHAELGVPIGLINTSWGGTPAEAWTSMGTLRSDPALAGVPERWARIAADYPQARAVFRQNIKEWHMAVERAAAEGLDPPLVPNDPIGPGHCHQPAGLYNGMLAPLAPFAIRGVIWYQGESNNQRAREYRRLFPAMIADWRRVWGREDLPFLFVQIAGYGRPQMRPSECEWAELQEAQLLSLAVPHTAMVVTVDIGQEWDIHPKNKQDVGRRLGLAALATVHGRDIAHSGPIYESMSCEGDAIRLRFRHAQGGLLTSDGGPLKGFAVAGADRRFAWAQADIEDEAVLVRSQAVPEPVAVRYAWANNPQCNLVNAEGLPAPPFRSDDWPILSSLSHEQLLKVFPEPGAVEIPKAGTVVGGALSDWADVAPMPLPFQGGESGSLKLAWGEDGLYGVVQTNTGPPRTDRAMPWTGDYLQLFIEKDCARSYEQSLNASHFLFAPLPLEGPGGGLKRVVYGAHIFRDDLLECAWRPTEAGYALEFFIPAFLLEPARMEPGWKIGLNFVLVHEGLPVEVFYDEKYQLFVCQTPIRWGVGRFAN